MAKPTIVLVPGSFCPASLCWDKVVDKLHAAGYDAMPVELQSVSPPSTAPSKGMYDDAAHIAGVVEMLANNGKEVVLVTHSYGGIPGTQSVKNLSRRERKDQGKDGGIIALIYTAALLVKEGECSVDSYGEATAHSFVHVSGEYLSMEAPGAAELLFNDLPKDVGIAWARKLPGHAMKSFTERMTSTSHYDVPVTYIKCTDDNVVLPPHQQRMIDEFKAVTRSSVDVVEVTGGHCPMIVQIDKTAEAIINAAVSATGKA